MSNVLHKFRSYSYHHILIACDTTAIAEYIGGLSGGSVYSEIIIEKGPGGRVSYGDKSDSDGILVKSGPGGNYAIVMNGFSDAEFYISNVEWETWIAPEYAKTKSTDRDFLTTVSTIGTMSVIEPKGFRFLNIINNTIRALGSGAMGTVFVLKTVFIGHTDNGSAEYVSDVRPIMLSLTNIVGKFDEGGSRYEIEFVGQSNGLGKAPQYSKISLNNMSIASNTTLAIAMTELSSKLNTLYNQKVDEHINNGVTELQDRRRIKFEIVLDETYQDASYLVDKMTTDQIGNGQFTGGTISFGNVPNVEHMVRETMLRCSKVVKAAEEKPNKIFKIFTVVESDADNAHVKFHVKPFVVPEVTDASGTKLIDDVDHDMLTFNYIYTGKNVDIIELQMNMNLGFAFFQLLETVEPLTEDQSIHDTVLKADGARSNGTPDKATKKSIVHIPTPIQRLKDRSVKNPLSTSAFVEALNKFSAVETLETTFTIHGNPGLLNSFSTMPSEYAGKRTGSDDLSRWHSVPSLCKINISMPSNNSTLGIGPNDEFQTPFWYQGHYLILFIKQKFNRGLFTQELTVKNVPVSDNPVGAFEYDEKKQLKVIK